MEQRLWRNPLEGAGETERVRVMTALGPTWVLVNRDSRKPIVDHDGRMVIGETSDGCLRVLERDGYEVVSGKKRWRNDDGVRCVSNMYTGELFIGGLRVRLPVKGPLFGHDLPLAKQSEIAELARGRHA